MIFIEVPVKMHKTEDASLEDMGIDMSNTYFDDMMMINVINIDHFYPSAENETEVWQNGVSVYVQMSYNKFKELINNLIG